MATLPIDALIDNLKAVQRDLLQKSEDIARGAAMDFKALAEKRIIEDGFGRFYSEKKFPAFFLYGKELNQRGKAFLKRKGVNPRGIQDMPPPVRANKKKGIKARPSTIDDILTNWKEFREVQGLPVDHIDLFYSGEMWHNMGVISVVFNGNVCTATLGGLIEIAQKKMDWNAARFGTFLQNAINAEDSKFINDNAANKLINILKDANV